jgi:hypothetical protein
VIGAPLNKTADIEWEIAWVLAGGPLTLAEMEERPPAEIRAVDRRWIGVAVYGMLRDGRIRAVVCDLGSHDGDCVVEVAR